MSDLYGPGEFGLADKVEDTSHLEGRLKALRRMYRRDPRVAAEVISYAWPHPAKRGWTDAELRERLGLPGAVKAASVYLKEAAAEFLYKTLPSVASAFDAYEAERARQEALSARENALRFPAMNLTQPQFATLAMGGSGLPSVPSGGHHHRRHHHHS